MVVLEAGAERVEHAWAIVEAVRPPCGGGDGAAARTTQWHAPEPNWRPAGAIILTIYRFRYIECDDIAIQFIPVMG